MWDEEAALERTVAWAVDLLDDGGVLIADEMGDLKSSTDAVAAVRHVGRVALCQVAAHLNFATSAGHCLGDVGVDATAIPVPARPDIPLVGT